jgi:hypothetical protein
MATDVEKRHGRQTRWELKIKEAPKHFKVNWPGSPWIVELTTIAVPCKGTCRIACHRFITSLHTTPEALLRLVCQHSGFENEWHWVRDTQLGEDARRYTHRSGAAVFSFLRTVVMDLLCRCSYQPLNPPRLP